MSLRSAKTFLYVAVAVAVLGCGRGSTPGATSSAVLGTLSGQARLYGGPQKADGGQAMNGEPAPGVTVSVSRGDRKIASATTHQDGLFSFDLPPGDYTVSGCTTFVVRVSAATTTTHDLDCPIP